HHAAGAGQHAGRPRPDPARLPGSDPRRVSLLQLRRCDADRVMSARVVAGTLRVPSLFQPIGMNGHAIARIRLAGADLLQSRFGYGTRKRAYYFVAKINVVDCLR